MNREQLAEIMAARHCVYMQDVGEGSAIRERNPGSDRVLEVWMGMSVEGVFENGHWRLSDGDIQAIRGRYPGIFIFPSRG